MVTQDELRGDLGPIRMIRMADSSEEMLLVLRDKISALDAVNLHPVKLDLAVDSLPADRFDLVPLHSPTSSAPYQLRCPTTRYSSIAKPVPQRPCRRG